MRQTLSGRRKECPTRGERSLSRRALLGVLGAGGLAAVAGCLGKNTETDYEAGGDEDQFRTAATNFLTTATLYKAPNCNCCLEYTDYLKETADADIDVVEVDDLAETKAEYNVPKDVESCHTIDTGQYFVEGHVPREAIGKMAVEEPDIAGISLPEMPRGSPGMPGEKTEDFVIYAVKNDGSYHEFMRL